MNKKITGAVLGTIVLAASPASAENEWANVQPAWDINNGNATIRVEAGADITERLKAYGFADAYASGLDFNSLYGEFRLAYDVSKETGVKGLKLAAEYNGGTDVSGKTRLGFAYVPQLGTGNFTQIKLFPANIGGENDPQISLFTEQKIDDSLKLNFLIDHALKTGSSYVEAGAEVNVLDGMSIFMQLRGNPDKLDPFVGMKYEF